MNDTKSFIYIKQMYMKGFFSLEDRCKEKISLEDYWDFIISPYREGELEGVDTEKMCIQELDFGYKSVSLDSRMLLPLSLRQYWYGAIPKCYTLLDMQPLDAAGIITLQNYPTLQLMGEGIMIGFLDTGIDYTHPVFRNLDGTTRIAGIWDQTIQDGDPPEGFLYGTEYTEERINAALHSESPQELISSEDTDGNICCKCGCRKCRKQWTVSWGCPGGGDRDGKAEAGKKISERIFCCCRRCTLLSGK